jgi:NhaA family Na+:H+ antiporter
MAEIRPDPHGSRGSRTIALLQGEAAGGIALIAAAALAMVVANLPATRNGYVALLHAAIGPLTVHQWIDDGAMALFFLVVGLEIKRELLVGRLATPAARMLPFVAAAAGMAVPAIVYLAIAGGTPGLARGWAIPAATDIAFAVGVMALLGPRVPASLKVFLTAVAVVDDMGAVAIIALAYSHGLDAGALAAAAGVLALMTALNRRGVVALTPYLLLAALLWACVLRSGIHATVAGVLAAFAIPLRVPGADATPSPLIRLEHALAPWVAFLIVPLFAIANAGVSLAGIAPATLGHPLVLGIAAGLFVGKQAGIMGSVWLADRCGVALRPAGASWRQVHGIALLGGIGFTMSLFIGQLAFPGDPALGDRVKLGVLAGSLLAAGCGYLVLRRAAADAEPPRM